MSWRSIWGGVYNGEDATNRLAQLVEYRTTMREVGGLNPCQTNTQGLLTKQKVLPF